MDSPAEGAEEVASGGDKQLAFDKNSLVFFVEV